MLWQRYSKTQFRAPIPRRAIDAFAAAHKFVQKNNRPVILDSGCGNGESSYYLAARYPQHSIVAVDKSAHRLSRAHAHGPQAETLLFARADCISLWRLIRPAGWPIERHFLFYPNPWPKPGHLQRRWHAHPVFPTLLSLGGRLTLRTNWPIYAREFSQALDFFNKSVEPVLELQLTQAITPFERKYMRSQHKLFAVLACL